MDNLTFRRYKNAPISQSKGAAAHTAKHYSSERPATAAGNDDEKSNVVMSEGHHLGAPKNKEPAFKRFQTWLKGLTKKQWIIISIAGVVLLGGIGTGLFFVVKGNEAPMIAQTEPAPEPEPEPVIYYSNLTGLEIPDNSINERPVTAIMIENSLVARPQSGLNEAGVVFEAIAEGGITRFVALYQDTEPDYIGPVRSVRPYYVQWAKGFDAAIAHVGGSPDGLALVRQTKDLDQFAGAAYFWRVGNRSAPHNVYTSIAKLREYEAKKGYGQSNFTSLSRKEEKPLATPTAGSIDLNVSSSNYSVHYDYDPATNTYKRFLAGDPHTDERSGKQIAPKSVVAFVASQGSNGKYTTYSTIGSGPVFVFQDGFVHTGTWTKDADSSQFKFVDNNDDEIKLNPGQTWFTVLGGTDRVSFAP